MATTPLRLALYVHPFDLDALASVGGLTRVRDLGFDEIALAVSYHAGRWLMPWHPAGRVRFLEDGTVHFRPRDADGELQPLPSSHVGSGPSPLAALCDAAPRAGLRVRAWTIGTHNTRLGRMHAARCVENAFGDHYSYALCPSQPAVRDYLLRLVRDLAAHDGLGTIELEAFGQLGWKHGSHHDKASFAPAGLLDAALSACFCDACRATMTAAGTDPEPLRERVRTFVHTHVTDGDAMAPAAVPASADDAAAAWLEPVLATRRAATAALARAIVDATPATARAVQIHPDPWFTGSQLAAAAAVVFPAADERVVTAYNEGPDAIGRLLAHDGMRAHTSSPKRLCVWPKAPQFRSDDDLRTVRSLCTQAGVTSVAIYHAGLLPWRTIERCATVLTR